MCGIIGILGTDLAAPRLLDGLRRLEYRGYDSAGIATLVNGQIDRRRAEGKLRNLDAVLAADPLPGVVGIGHTRWATHGVANTTNAHPHTSDRVALVHNGIIENFRPLRAELEAKGYSFATETDTEVIVYLLTDLLKQGLSPKQAMVQGMQRLEGAFAIAVLVTGEDGLLMGARRGSPLAVGYGDGEMFLGSDALALGPLTRRIAYLEEGDIAILSRESAEILNEKGETVERRIQIAELSGAIVGKGNYKHFMEKEIHEQPATVGETLNGLVDAGTRGVVLPALPFDLTTVDRVTLVACGTSYYAAMVAKYWIESLAQVPVELDIASEFRYRNGPVLPGSLALFVSQSGETVDTLAALRYAKAKGAHTAAVVNVPTSAMAREADVMLRTLAGPEIGVATTKAFTAQLSVLACFATALGRARGLISADREAQITQALMEIPARLAEGLVKLPSLLTPIVEEVAEARDVLYLGRGLSYPLAMEGALKLKEISYIHAEGYAAGEMKHGPIALIDETVPVIALAPEDSWFEKTVSNLQEVAARRGRVIVFTTKRGAEHLRPIAAHVVEMPDIDPLVSPLLYALPVQMLAYYVAVRKGTDVDQPRNLAKSVTVE
ncbi:glutamine--fructose-6-phosphate transaminase (isomerizing) [Elstera sp.]|jgi:glucosamine--fructose-6-phosphate aminotransferase (isomerizing)|uniref:glutamine--fructose-6-phosphate transaminase (isomerizing) n=1 Tax=Elstera sp. TaxID=1916664 RepID=UPI0037BF68A4